MYGSVAEHTETFVVETVSVSIVKFKVAIESQPAVLVVLKVYVPAILYGVPFQVYGNAAEQTEIFVVETVSFKTLRFKVATESQPAAFVVLKVYVPALLYGVPFQVYGNVAEQTETLVVETVSFKIVRFNVAVESQPAAFVVLNVYVPPELYGVPFQVYGNVAEHTETLVVEIVSFSIVKFKVAVESQPAAFVVLKVYVPLELYRVPFQVYGNVAAQTETLVVDVVSFKMVRFNVAVESQPAAFVVLKV